MKAFFASVLLLAACAFSTLLVAQDPPEMPKPTAEHKWLSKFHGTWTSKSKGMMGPGQPEMECSGEIVCKPLGEFWIVNDMQGDAFGDPMRGIQTIGYDPENKKYVGTWVDSLTSFMWKYEGSVDATGKILTLEADGPNFMGDPKTTTKFQDIYEFRSESEMIVTSKMLGPDGKWVTFMSGVAKKKK